MEGGDTWAYDPQTSVHAMFKINGLDDGNSDLGLIFGQAGSFAEDLVYPYSGDNSYIDRIEPIDNAFELFRNQVPSYCNAVALDEGTYKTVGFSFEFGSLSDNSQCTKEELMILILEFFGGILTDVDEAGIENNMTMNAWPNPFNDEISFSIDIQEGSHISLEIYDLSGKKIRTIANAQLQSGQHQFSWDGTSVSGNNASEGMYIYILQNNTEQKTGKIILNR